MKRGRDVAPTRREVLRFGGLGLGLASAVPLSPLRAAGTNRRTASRGNARNVVYFEISGGISHVDTWDFKENAGTPKDLDVRRIATDLDLSHRLFPNFAKQIGKFAIVRSMVSDEEVHFRGQYSVQTGRPLDLAVAREIPAVGSVVAMELEQRRRPHDTLPTYLSFNLDKAFPGALSSGFLHPRHSVVEINPEAAMKGMAPDGTAHRRLSDDRWRKALQITKEDRERYGNTPIGISCILARNALAMDAGAHYIHICHPGWDHHVSIWDRTQKSNHYVLCSEFDLAFSSLIEELSRTKANPGKTLLDETLVVAMSEFGRTPGRLNNMQGRDHHNRCFPALFAGAGVKGGAIIGRTDKEGSRCVETGWHRKEQPRMENVAATIYSALGIDWTREIRDTPSGRAFRYVDLAAADEIAAIYG